MFIIYITYIWNLLFIFVLAHHGTLLYIFIMSLFTYLLLGGNMHCGTCMKVRERVSGVMNPHHEDSRTEPRLSSLVAGAFIHLRSSLTSDLIFIHPLNFNLYFLQSAFLKFSTITKLRETALINYCGLSNKLYFSVYQWLWYNSSKTRKRFCHYLLCCSFSGLESHLGPRAEIHTFVLSSPSLTCPSWPWCLEEHRAVIQVLVLPRGFVWCSQDEVQIIHLGRKYYRNAAWLQNPTRRHLMSPAPSCGVWLCWFRSGVCQLAPLWGSFFL